MKDSICKFMPAKEYSDSIKAVNFVYETEFKKLRQPFFKSTYVLNLVTRGKGTLLCEGYYHSFEKGDIFFNFPTNFFQIEASSDFEFAYISFTGECVNTILENFGISTTNCVFRGFGHITEHWLSSLRRLDEFNANILTESVLLYTLSFFGNKGSKVSFGDKDDLFVVIMNYIEKHLTDPEICLRRVSGIFAYSQKYFSHLFKNNVGIGFCEYVNEKRIKYALTLIDEGIHEVSTLSERSGFTDPLYFSKVFKKYAGTSPRSYISGKK